MKNNPGSLWQTTLLTDPDTKIELLFATVLINQKARNVCHLNGIYTLRSLVNHYLNKGTFTGLSSCGEITSNELIEYVKKVLAENPHPYYNLAEEHPLVKKLRAIRTADSGQIYEQYIALSASMLPTRAANAVNSVLDNREALYNYKIWLLLKERPKEIENVGEASAKHITNFVETSLKFIDTLEANTFTGIIQLLELFSLANYKIDNAKRFIQVKNNKIYLGDLFVEILRNSSKTNGTWFETLEKFYGIFSGTNPMTQTEFIDYIGLTNERLRQLNAAMPERIKSAFKPLRRFILPLKIYFPEVYFPVNQCIFVNQQFYKNLSESDRKHLSIKGLAYYQYALSDHFSAIYPHPDDSNQAHYLLLSDTLVQTYRLPELIKTIKSEINAKRVEDEKTDLKAIAPQWPDETEDCYVSFLFALKSMVKNEFDIEILEDQYIVLPRNKKPFQWEYIESVLQKHGAPMHLQQLFEQVHKDVPGEFEKPGQLRSAILRNREVFFSIGKTSTYGLNSWKKDLKFYRTEPIADLVYQWLQKADMPRHQYDVTRFVRIFRDSKENSILNILKLDKDDRFRFFPGGFIGLYEKDYKAMRTPFNTPEADTEAMIIHMIHDQGPVNKIDLINKAARRYGLETVQVEYIIDSAIKKNIIQKVNEFLL